MKKFLSFLFRNTSKSHNIGFFSNIEKEAQKTLSPSDWLVVGVLGFLMAFGAIYIFASLSSELSIEIPKKGGVHVEGVIGSPRFINPLLATSETDSDITELVFAGLLKREADGSLSGNLAKSFEVSEDRLSYTFHLEEGARFHDGTPVTAEDVVFTIQSAKNPDIKSPKRANWEGVDVIAVDQSTVVFTLKAPYALFLENAVMGILPKHLWGAVRPEEFAFSELNAKPVGAGLFKVSQVKKNSSGVPTEYTLISFAQAVHPAFINKIIFKFYPNQDALQNAFNEGAIDAAHSIIPNSTRNTVHEAVFGRVFGVFFNQNQQELFTDIVVRKALDASLDKEDIVSKLLSGYGTPLNGPLPPESVSEESVASESGDHVQNARDILESNGWKLGEDGIYILESKKETKRLRFSLTTGNVPELREAAEQVVSTWRTLGAEVELKFFDQNDLNLEVIRPRKYDALLFGLVIGQELDLFAFWHASQRNDPGLNIALYANISTDKLLEDAREEADQKLRREKAQEAADEIAKEYAAVFLYAPHFLYLTENELRGVSLGTISTPSNRFSGVNNWYIKTEKVWPLFAY